VDSGAGRGRPRRDPVRLLAVVRDDRRRGAAGQSRAARDQPALVAVGLGPVGRGTDGIAAVVAGADSRPGQLGGIPCPGAIEPVARPGYRAGPDAADGSTPGTPQLGPGLWP